MQAGPYDPGGERHDQSADYDDHQEGGNDKVKDANGHRACPPVPAVAVIVRADHPTGTSSLAYFTSPDYHVPPPLGKSVRLWFLGALE